MLPPRLFATDRYPDAQLNIYLKPEILLQIRDPLEGTSEFATILRSPFGKLWDFPFVRCHISCKFIHALLVRQIVTQRKYELWTVFGGQPLRFSIVEFGSISGLECGDFPEDYNQNSNAVVKASDVPYWKELFGDDTDITLAKVYESLKSSPDMPFEKRLRLALILIVDGVFIANDLPHRITPTPKFVAMLEDIDSFLRFPWGRESFLRTVHGPKQTVQLRRRKSAKVVDPVSSLCERLQQKTVHIQGFPFVLQLLALQYVPALLSRIPNCKDMTSLLNSASTELPHRSAITLDHVWAAENDRNLIVEPLMYLDTERGDEWEDETRTKKTLYMVNLISDGYMFKKEIWPGGNSSLPLYIYKSKSTSKIRRTVLRRKFKPALPADKLSPARGRSQCKKYSSNRR